MSINATLIVQMIVFAILVWFTMRFVWPPITAALDERAKKIAEGLSAADKAKADLASAHRRVEQQLAAARDDVALSDQGLGESGRERVTLPIAVTCQVFVHANGHPGSCRDGQLVSTGCRCRCGSRSGASPLWNPFVDFKLPPTSIVVLSKDCARDGERCD